MSTPSWIPTDAELDGIARTVPAPDPTPERTEHARTTLLANAAVTSQLRGRTFSPALVAAISLGVAAAAALVLWLAVRPPAGDGPKQVVEAIGDATLTRISDWPDYVVRVDRGRVAVTVAHLAATERFRVQTADAEVEVRGTRFTLTVEASRLLLVDVEQGRVEVRRPLEPLVTVSAGERWAAPPAKTAQRDAPTGTAADAIAHGTTAAPPTSSAANDAPAPLAKTAPAPKTTGSDVPAAPTRTAHDHVATPPTKTAPAPKTTGSDVLAAPKKIVPASATASHSDAVARVGSASPAGASRASASNPSAAGISPLGTSAPGASSASASKPSGAGTSPSGTSAPGASRGSASDGSTGSATGTSRASATDASTGSTPGTSRASATAASKASAAGATASGGPGSAPGEAEFRAGVSALRAGDAGGASRSFADACAAARAGAIGEDACFWAGAAARRASDSSARAALDAFLQRFPRSARAGEAAALLGWILVEAGDLDGAARRFDQAAADRVPKVRESAERGREAIRRARSR